MIDFLTNYGSSPISVTDLIISMIVAVFLGLYISAIYNFTHRGITYDKSYVITLTLIAPLIAFIITLIGNNIALSLGLVGSLSIIRFRTVIKEARDLIFLLWGIGVGLGAGTENWFVSCASTFIISIFVLSLHGLRIGTQRSQNLVIVVTGDDRKICEECTSVLADVGFEYRFRSLNASGGNWKVVYEVKSAATTDENLSAFSDRLREHNNVKTISVLSPNTTLPI